MTRPGSLIVGAKSKRRVRGEKKEQSHIIKQAIGKTNAEKMSTNVF